MMTTKPVPTPEELRAAVDEAIAEGNYERPLEWETAFHEAGHVVAEVAGGSYPDSVYLNDDAAATDHAGRTTSRSFGGVKFAPCGSRLACCWAMVLAAGSLAEGIARGWPVDVADKVGCLVDEDEDDIEGKDERELRRLVADMRPGDAEDWLEEAFHQSEQLLRRRWGDVEKVASALVERRHLDRSDLWDLLLDEEPLTPQ